MKHPKRLEYRYQIYINTIKARILTPGDIRRLESQHPGGDETHEVGAK